jgi:NDP-sugar pyrophosphorylase family protein
MINNILILAAGRGLRLHPLTIDKPKPLLEIDSRGTTILDRLLWQCRSLLPEVPVYINVGFRAETILLHFRDTPHKFRPTFLYEPDILGPAATLVQFSKNNRGRTLVIYGDLILSSEGFSKFVRFAKSTESQIIVCHYRERFKARSEVISLKPKNTMEKIIEHSSFEVPFDSETEELIQVSSGLFLIHLSNVTDFKALRGESLSPRLLNFINSDVMSVYLWEDWRFAIDSLTNLHQAKLKIALPGEREKPFTM